LVRLPVAPGEPLASRRGTLVEVQFVVPAANTDGSSPADVSRVDVYGFTGPASVTGEEIVRRGSKVGSVLVNPPPDPDEDPDAEKPARSAKDAPPGAVNQGSVARVTEDIAAVSASEPRSYVSVGVNTRGRRGPVSSRTAVPMGPAPPAPAPPAVTYTETGIRVAWAPTPPIADSTSTSTYHVYDVGPAPRRLTDRALEAAPFVDNRIEWGAERCYALRTMLTSDGLTVESEASPPVCVTPIDTFPPGAPTGLTAVAGTGSISLIWNASPEKDVAGYLVLRAIAPATDLAPVTPAPIPETTFSDAVPPGARVIYAIQAVDHAGNVSLLSSSVEETAR
jgi:hypothetical protein